MSVTEPELQYGSVNLFVCLLNNFEQAPVPGVTENRYLAYAERWGWLSEGRHAYVAKDVVTKLFSMVSSGGTYENCHHGWYSCT
jgi:hypothetical protein